MTQLTVLLFGCWGRTAPCRFFDQRALFVPPADLLRVSAELFHPECIHPECIARAPEPHALRQRGAAAASFFNPFLLADRSMRTSEQGEHIAVRGRRSTQLGGRLHCPPPFCA